MIIKAIDKNFSIIGRVNGKKFAFINGQLETSDQEIINYVTSNYKVESSVKVEIKEESEVETTEVTEVVETPKKKKK